MAMTVAQKVKAAQRHGIKSAPLVYEVWKNRNPKPPGFDFPLACALLMQETGGGNNIFGHDPTIYVGAGLVTKAKYLAYKKKRGSTGRGGMQGVGFTQLTYYSYQDEADALGGCWIPRYQMHVGFVLLRDHVARYGLFAGVAAYNGTGPAAQAYARSVLSIRQNFEHYLSTPKLSLDHLAALAPYEPTKDDLRSFAEYERLLLQEAALGDPHAIFHISRNEPERVPAKGDPKVLSH